MTVYEVVAILGAAAVVYVAVVLAALDRVLKRRGLRLVESVRRSGRVHRVKIRQGRDGRGYARVVSPKRP